MIFTDRIWFQKKGAFDRRIASRILSHVSDAELDRFAVMTAAAKTAESVSAEAVTCPVLVLGAEGDRVIDVSKMRELAELYGAESCFYDETYGHAVSDEAPDYYRKIYEFLKKAL